MAEKTGPGKDNPTTYDPSMARTPKTNASLLPNRSEWTTQLAGAPGLANNAADGKSYLLIKKWILQDDMIDTYKLSDILLADTLKYKMPEQAIATIRAVGWLLAEGGNNTFIECIAEASAVALYDWAEPLIKDFKKHRDALAKEHKFLNTTGTTQLSTTTQLADMVKVLGATSNSLKDTSGNMRDTTKKHNAAVSNVNMNITKITKASTTIVAAIMKINDSQSHIQSLADSVKQLMDAAAELKAVKPLSLSSPATTQTWASVASNNVATLSVPNSNMNKPSHIPRITQLLLTAAKQLYVEFNPSDAKAPKEHMGPAAHALCTQFNTWMKELDSAKNALTDLSRYAICAIQFLNREAFLKFDSVELLTKFQDYCTNNSLLMCLCDSMRIKPQSYKPIFKFVPCMGSFDPTNADHIHVIEEDQCLPLNAITSTSWIKKPKFRHPGQTISNLKVICSTTEYANHFIKDRVYIVNLRVEVKKDIQEPLCCNKCHEYGHIRDKCTNTECCGNCAWEHATNNCTNPTELHCISCSVALKHTSVNRNAHTLSQEFNPLTQDSWKITCHILPS